MTMLSTVAPASTCPLRVTLVASAALSSSSPPSTKAMLLSPAVGAVPGVRVGDTRMGGIDVLVGVTALPNRQLGDVHVGGKPFDLALGVK